MARVYNQPDDRCCINRGVRHHNEASRRVKNNFRPGQVALCNRRRVHGEMSYSAT